MSDEYKKTLTGNYRYKFCVCGHTSRDHNRSTKKNGIWTGICTVEGCNCKEYTYKKKEEHQN